MAALEMSEQQTADNSVASGPASGERKGHQERLLDITNRVHSASNIDEILIDLRDDIIKLFEAERLTIYVVDGIKKDLVSRVKSGDEISEIRVPISTTSLVGYSAYKGRPINIKNVYDEKELAAIDPKLNFDKSWDERTGFRTRQALVAPVSFQKYLMGAIQLINRKDGMAFNERDEAAVQELSQTLGIALFNQKRMAKARPGKFDYLIENGLLTQKEADKAVLE
ncbi:MAG: GAF domain-containing protein, partial [Desulfobacteria bacterium]